MSLSPIGGRGLELVREGFPGRPGRPARTGQLLLQRTDGGAAFRGRGNSSVDRERGGEDRAVALNAIHALRDSLD